MLSLLDVGERCICRLCCWTGFLPALGMTNLWRWGGWSSAREIRRLAGEDASLRDDARRLGLILRARTPAGTKRTNAARVTLVAEVADSSEDHGEAETVGSLDDLLIADGASGLNDRSCAGPGDFFHAIRKRKERIGGSHCAFQWELCFHCSDFGRIHAA